MPLYEFDCLTCGSFNAYRSIAGRDEDVLCPKCGVQASRIISAPNLAVMSPVLRQAHARNEKSCHEPRVSTGHRCGTGCGCGKPGVKLGGEGGRTVEVPKLGKFKKQRKQKRPWMLGH